MALKRRNRITGKDENIPKSEIKATTMLIRGWSESEYNKQRYLIKNKLRALETLEGRSAIEKQSPSELLYKQSLSMQRAKRMGEEYEPSFAMKRLQSMPATGNVTRYKKQLERESYREKVYSRYSSETLDRFAGLISKDAKAMEIAEKITDPIKREQALTAYANAKHLVVDRKRKAQANEAIPLGETFGSESIEFDYSMYE